MLSAFWVAAPPRPTPIPVLVGSDTFGRVQSGIPTQRPGPRGLSGQGEHSSQLPAKVDEVGTALSATSKSEAEIATRTDT